MFGRTLTFAKMRRASAPQCHQHLVATSKAAEDSRTPRPVGFTSACEFPPGLGVRQCCAALDNMSNRGTFLYLVILVMLAAFSSVSETANTLQELREGFQHPPDSARPWVYWFWVDGNITREGITADLEAMQRVGIGGAILFDVDQRIPPGPVRFGSAEWRELFQHALHEAARLGLQLSVHNSAGWTGSGGPWITPDLAMRQIVSSKTNVTGPEKFSGPLPRLMDEKLSRSVATLAFPALVGEGTRPVRFSPRITDRDSKLVSVTNLLDGDPKTFVALPAPTRRKPQYLQLEFAEPYTASQLKLTGTARAQSFQGELQVSDDGRKFRQVREFLSARSGVNLPFEQTSAHFYRIVFIGTEAGQKQLEFSELELSPLYRIKFFHPKAGLGALPAQEAQQQNLPTIPPEGLIKPDTIVDLTTNIDAAGNLMWDVPKGNWTILRIAHSPVGTMNHPARPDGDGLESDKLNREATETHFHGFLAKLVADSDASARKAFVGAHIDSWEIGFQNWTPNFPEEFHKRRSYDMHRFLPALTGRYVESAEESERFLWDMRRTVADLLADNYATFLAELLHSNAMQLSIQGYGSLGDGPFDDLVYGSRADVPMAEFWLGTNANPKLELHSVASEAHICGKKIAAAESFTSYPEFSAWREHPFMLKPLADVAFCEGINRLAIHRYAHQPWPDRAPGMTMGPWGVHYERTQTWWEQSKPWHEYLTRCQFLLQQGSFVADICYLTKEGSYCKPPFRSALEPPLPDGYDYDLISPEALLKNASVRDGRLVLPDGMSYAVLVVPNVDRMTPELLRRIRELVESGAMVFGPRPVKSPSLANYPKCDAEVEKLAAEVWSSCDGKTVKEHRFGKGVVMWGKGLDEVLGRAGASPDFQTISASSGLPLAWIHRRVSGSDIYFVANWRDQPLAVDCRFRASSGEPEIWHADSGRFERPAEWWKESGATTVPLRFDPGGSLFVVFSEGAKGLDPVRSVTRNSQNETTAQLTFDAVGKLQLLGSKTGVYKVQMVSGKAFQTEIKSLPDPIPISGKWRLTFPTNSGAPASITLDALRSWSEHVDPGVKYFSGTAEYSISFSLSGNVFGPGRQLSLDLGRVAVIAEVKLNGKDCGVLWKPPYETDITAAAKAGENVLQIKAVNCWPNRLIGDEQLPPDCKWADSSKLEVPIAEWPQWLLEGKPSPAGRHTFTTWKHWGKDSALLDSGLLGPVMIRVSEQRTLE